MTQELRKKLEKVCIKASNLTEKVAAHYFLHGKFGTELPKNMDRPNFLYIGLHPYRKQTDSWVYPDSHSYFINFKDLHKFDEWFESIDHEETVVLNDSYSAVVTRNGIKVGCQTFPLSIVAELQKAVDKVTK